MDKDLSNHGSISYDTSLSGYSRDLPDVDLSDHGAVSYDTSLSGYSRDLPDVDLSDHGAIYYEPKSVTWGTNDEELVKQMNILMRATYSNNVEQVIPLLNAASLAKVVEYRYRQVANILDDGRYGLGKEEKEKLGILMYMDFFMIDKMISLNPNCLQPIFNPSLYLGSQELTNVFGMLEMYQQGLDSVGIQIPLINGSTGEIVKDKMGKSIVAQEVLDYLIAKKEMYTQEFSGRKSL